MTNARPSATAPDGPGSVPKKEKDTVNQSAKTRPLRKAEPVRLVDESTI